MTEDDLEADVARLRAKWFGPGSSQPQALDQEEKAVAAKWLGKAEADKLARTPTGRTYRPPVVHAHYGYIPRTREDTGSSYDIGGYWYVEVFQGATKAEVFRGERSPCLQAVARMERMGITVTRVGSERAPEELRKPTKARSAQSQRRSILEQLKGYKP